MDILSDNSHAPGFPAQDDSCSTGPHLFDRSPETESTGLFPSAGSPVSHNAGVDRCLDKFENPGCAGDGPLALQRSVVLIRRPFSVGVRILGGYIEGVQHLRRLQHLFFDAGATRQIIEQSGDNAAITLATQMEVKSLHRHLGRLMGRETSPFVPLTIDTLFGKFQVPYSLGPPVPRPPS